MKKKFLSFALAFVLCLGLIPSAFAAGFTDITPGQYYYVPVLWAVEKGITGGTTNTTFSPQDTCTIGQILTFLWRSAGKPVPSGPNPFSDVAETDYYASAASWASEKGLISGTVLNPKAPCTRSMVMTYLWKLSGSPSADSSSFTDVPADAEYAPAVAWAVRQGITGGTTNTTFSPQDTCTRGQIVTFLYRYNGSPNVAPTVTSYASFPSVPDFGAFAFVSPMKTNMIDDAHYFYYDPADISAKNPNRDLETILSEYIKLLTANGFSLMHSYTADEGPVIAYTSTDTMFSMGVAAKDGVVSIMVRPVSEAVANTTSGDGIHYKEFPGVPDFGAVTGVLPIEVEPGTEYWTYTYNTSNMTQEQVNKYAQLMDDEGFVVIDAGTDSRKTYVMMTNGKNNVMAVQSDNMFIVAVYF